MNNILHLRMLETWLPLAHQLDILEDWRCSAYELEVLILSTWSRLQKACSADEARAMLRSARSVQGRT